MEEKQGSKHEKADSGLIKRLTEFFWIRLSLWGLYGSRTMPLTMTDGIHLTAWPRWGALAPPVALLTGLLFGWFHLGYEYVYSESILFLTIAVILGIFSAHLGLMFLVGFIFGEFVLSLDWSSTPGFGRNGVVENVVFYRIPLLISYGLLAVLLVKIPVLTKQLLVQIRPPQGLSEKAKTVFVMIGHGLLTGVMVYFWVQIMPVLIRPVFTWLSRNPRVDAIETFQVYGFWLVMIAVFISILRVYLQSLTTFRAELRKRMDRVADRFEQKLEEKPNLVPLGERLHPWIHTVLVSAMLTLVLAGLYESWLDAFLLGAFILVLQAARARLIPVPLGKWPEWMERIPLLYRLIIGFVLLLYLSHTVLDYTFSSRSYTFRPVILLTGLAMLITFLLNPGDPKPRPRPSSFPSSESKGGPSA
ncbi:hypothetical protein [Desmospora profundinema]|uniref:MFS family permease n=1 Tax=Desmospora profundinema TaxID=1571184 RepID=A0ABU1INH5_9BACL|nr:hypothetical protein [Desmospora profundinema]MDR6226335.1 MFS family permease [Desmospora profundinema]